MAVTVFLWAFIALLVIYGSYKYMFFRPPNFPPGIHHKNGT